eukprot:TRINITY_DN3335_c0_g2_i1.p3 TRINITY_DN3335_c0_g2~~TRINITY_DN3335_c0_g2_i1.p3  ORF type:complete len:103 (-),score=5.92 TRINITY_DN3335_c0_g2_i1:117-425(-)
MLSLHVFMLHRPLWSSLGLCDCAGSMILSAWITFFLYPHTPPTWPPPSSPSRTSEPHTTSSAYESTRNEKGTTIDQTQGVAEDDHPSVDISKCRHNVGRLTA